MGVGEAATVLWWPLWWTAVAMPRIAWLVAAATRGTLWLTVATVWWPMMVW